MRNRFESEEPEAIRILGTLIDKEHSVLDVGCGNFPHRRANVCCDVNPNAFVAAEHPGQRFVEADVHHLPFGPKEFDWVICRQVLEHVRDPVIACAELDRVARRGYIELPTAIAEIVTNTENHLWLCGLDDEGLLFRPKPPMPFWTGPGEFFGLRLREGIEGFPADAIPEMRRMLEWAGQYRICHLWEGALRGRILWG